MLFALLFIIVLAILAAYFVLNQKNETQERVGTVLEVLNKDALFVEFEDKRSNVVKLFGLHMATEREMLDEQIFNLLHSEVKGKRIRVKPVRVDTGEILVSEVYSMAGEYLNAILIRQGFARWNPSEAATDKRLSDAQETAQRNAHGVWNPTVQKLMSEGGRAEEAGEERADTESESNEKAEAVSESLEESEERDSTTDRESVPAGTEARPQPH